jgi:hypothetical protein
MKRFFILFFSVGSLFLASCSKDDINNGDNNGGDDNGFAPSTIKGTFTESITLKADSTYTLDGIVYITNGATITIQPGAIIKAKKGKTALVITRGAKIDAQGTAAKPIVFTSEVANPNPVNGDLWGGIVVLGKATTNQSFNGQAGVGEIEGGINDPSTNYGLYGGNDDNDNSGKIKYVRIEHAGYPFLPEKELNALTLGAVGSQTEIDYVQVSYAYDDAYEMFGGTVNLKHIISYRTNDDDFDCDNGYRGKIQFAIAVRDKDIADVSGANGFEQDNDANGTATAPLTAPVFSNVTLIGPKADAATAIHANFKRAAHIRRNSRTSIYNSVLMGFPTGILIDGATTAANVASGALDLRNVIVAGCNKPVDTAAVGGYDVKAEFNKPERGNQILAANTEVMLANAFNLTSFDPTPTAGSPLLTGASFSAEKLQGGFFTTTTYKGAVGTGDEWWKGWTRFFNR